MPLSIEKLQWIAYILGRAALLSFHFFRGGHYIFSSALMENENTDSPFLHDDALLPAILSSDTDAALMPDPAFQKAGAGLDYRVYTGMPGRDGCKQGRITLTGEAV